MEFNRALALASAWDPGLGHSASASVPGFSQSRGPVKLHNRPPQTHYCYILYFEYHFCQFFHYLMGQIDIAIIEYIHFDQKCTFTPWAVLIWIYP